jgi:hypothetical protein
LTTGDGGRVIVSGDRISLLNSTTANATTGNGGNAIVLGDRISLLNSTIDASGGNGGGSVQIGGYPGQNAASNTDETYIDAGSTITANALTTGDGGNVIVRADGSTRVDGTINAQGGEGGFAEIYGHQNLVLNGMVDVGATGTLIINPRTITISERPSTRESDININADVLTRQRGSVSLEATDGINVDDSLSLNFATCTTFPCSVSFNADADRNGVGSFTMEDRTQPITPLVGSITALGRSIRITGASITAGDISTNSNFEGSDPTIIVLSEIIQTNLNATAGSIRVRNINGGGDVSLSAEEAIFAGYIRNTILPPNAFGTSPSFDFTNRFGGLGGVSISTANGDIRVFGIDTEPGYINVRSGGLFQATQILGGGLTTLGTSYPSRSSERIDINAPENQEVRDSLISAGYLSYANGVEGRDFLVNTSKVRETLLASLTDPTDPAARSEIDTLSDADLASLFLSRDGDRALISPNRQGTPISLIVRGFSTEGNFVKITVGGTTVIDTASNIVSSSEFVIGPQIRSLRSQDFKLDIVVDDDDNDGSSFDRDRLISITALDYSLPLTFESERFPNTVSGTVGTILLSLGENNGFAGTALQPVEYQPPSPKGKTELSAPRGNSTDDENQEATLQASAEDEDDSENDACEMFEPTEVLSVSEVAPEECQAQETSEASE